MKDLAEIYQALLAGETLIDERDTCTVRLSKASGMVRYTTLRDSGRYPDFNEPELWRIYKEPQWYDNIPEDGVLCRVRDSSAPWQLDLILSYSAGRVYPFRGVCIWKNAEPIDLTKSIKPQLEVV